MNRRLWSLCALLWLCTLFTGCDTNSPPPALPPPQQLVSAGMLEPVRAQIDSAWRAAQAAPKDAAVSGALGMVLSAYGQSEHARTCYLRARLLDPQDFRWPYYEAVSLSDLGRTEEAIEVMKDALALRADHAEAQLRLAGWLAASQDPAQARLLYETVLSSDPRRAEAHLGLARLLMSRGDAQTAVPHLRAALDSDWQIGEVHYTLSRALRALGDPTGAEQHATLFRRFEGRRLHLIDPLVMAVMELNLGDKPHLTRANWYLERGQLGGAAAALEQALAINPDNPPARLDLMEVYARMGRQALAAAQYGAAIAQAPNDPESHLRWARLQRQALDYAGAATTFARALALQPERPDILAELGFVLEQQRHTDQATERYREALALDPHLSAAHAGLGRLLWAADDPAAAVPHLERAAKAPNAERVRLLYMLALAYRATGRTDLAREALAEAHPLAVAGIDLRLERDIEAARQTLQPTANLTQ